MRGATTIAPSPWAMPATASPAAWSSARSDPHLAARPVPSRQSINRPLSCAGGNAWGSHDMIRPAMGLEKPRSLALSELIEPDALRRSLTQLAKETGDPGSLRKLGLDLIK